MSIQVLCKRDFYLIPLAKNSLQIANVQDENKGGAYLSQDYPMECPHNNSCSCYWLARMNERTAFVIAVVHLELA